MKRFGVVMLVFLGLIIAYQIYSYRATYLSQFDKIYARDLYDHSQYSIPISPRTISDELLYQVAGNDYFKDWQLFKINPEAPPVGKYLYGLSIGIFNNAQVISIFVFLLCAFIYLKIAKYITKDNLLAFVCLFLFVLEPLIFSQISKSMLDLPQLFAFFIHIYSFLLLIDEEKKEFWKIFFLILLAGLSLGFFISIKIGFLAIAIVLADLIMLWKKRRLWFIVPIIGLTVFVYTASYLPYFLQGNNLISFIRAQKWIFNYWTSSKVRPIPGMIFLSFLTGLTKGWHQGALWERFPEWTVFWPFYLISYLMTLVLVIKNTTNLKTRYFYLIVLTGCLLFTLAIIPLFIRYLLLILPLFIIFFVFYLKSIKRFVIVTFLIVFFVQAYFFLHPDPTQVIKDIKRTWENGTYQDMYSFLDKNSTTKFNRLQFWRKMQSLEKNLGIGKRFVDISLDPTFPWQNMANGVITIAYQTRLGSYKNIQPITFFRKDGIWKMEWKDGLVLKNFTFADQIISSFTPGRFGTLKLQNGTVLSQEGIRPFFLIIPNQVKDDRVVQNQVSKLIGKQAYDVEILYRPNNQPDIPVEIGFLKEDLPTTYLQKIKLDKSVVVQMRKTRVYNLEMIKKMTLGSIKLIESKKIPQLNPGWGGEVLIKKLNGQKDVFQTKQIKDGIDVVLE